ncbi:MAG: T9SS type A sorting domain-containing protein [Bacteroidetes bacterium]|nr:T9SS type A sorting domain-containing protein [Bacteroidota bacterium]
MKNFLLVAAASTIIFIGSSAYVNNVAFHQSEQIMAYAMDTSGKIIDNATVDGSGNYFFPSLSDGTYQIVFKRDGYDDIKVANVDHIKGINYHANLDFKPMPIELVGNGTVSDEDLLRSGHRGVEGEKITYSKEDVELKATDKDDDAIEITPAKSPEMKWTSGTPATSDPSRDYSRRTASGTGTIKTAEVRVRKSAKMITLGDGYSDDATATRGETKSMAMIKTSGGGSSSTTNLKPGQITVGFWRDLDNWNKWKETNKDPNVAVHRNTWGFYPDNNRFSVKFLDSDGKPVIGKKVELWSNDSRLEWEAVTDNTGVAEFFAGLNAAMQTKELRSYKVKMKISERSFEFKMNPFNGSTDVVNIPVKYEVKPIADIAFVVDATGSMGDEIQYLQTELLDVITRVKKSNNCLDIRMGSVFYRDNTDDYITKFSNFSSNPGDIVNFIFDQAAGGGGDFPEAVDAAMETTMESLSWSENAVAKMMFLVLDAPPHSDSASAEKMRKYTKIAAAKGIKIIPITASGIDQSTEFLMKYLAIATNGNYVYITDHSGIGGGHAKPTGVKENVQYLNELLIDIINQNIAWNGCKDSTPNKQPGTVEIVSNGQWQVQIYPNPATDYIKIKSSELPDAIGIYDLNGNLVQSVAQIAKESNTIEIKNLSTGVYIVKCSKGSESVSCRILVMK